jgi:hypothetical protein
VAHARAAMADLTVTTYLIGAVIMSVGVLTPLVVLAYRYVLRQDQTQGGRPASAALGPR